MTGTQYLRCITYNSGSTVQPGRIHSISKELDRVKLVALQGTRIRRKPMESDHNFFHTDDHIIVTFGYGRGSYTNRSCGLTFLLNRRLFKRNDILKVFPVPNDLQGRCAALFIKLGSAQILLINAYFAPPFSQSTTIYKGCVDRIIAWMKRTLRTCKPITTPIICMDLNDGMQQWPIEDDQPTTRTITANFFSTSERHCDNYRLYLCPDCCSPHCGKGSHAG